MLGEPFFKVPKIRFADASLSSALLCFHVGTPVYFSNLGAYIYFSSYTNECLIQPHFKKSDLSLWRYKVQQISIAFSVQFV